MKWKDVKVGDVIDGCTITDIEDNLDYNNDFADRVFTFDLKFGGWSFWVVYPRSMEEEAFIKCDDNEELQLDIFEDSND